MSKEINECDHIMGYAQDLGYPPWEVRLAELHKPDFRSMKMCKHCPDCGYKFKVSF